MVMPYLPQGMAWATLTTDEKLNALHKGLNDTWDALYLTANECRQKANHQTDQLMAGTAKQVDEKFAELSRRITRLESALPQGQP